MINKAILKVTLTATTLLAASGYTMLAQAHCIGGNGNFDPTGLAAPITVPTISLLSGATNGGFQIDSYSTVCPAGTTRIKAGIAKRSGTAASNLNLEVVKYNATGGLAHTFVSDNTVTATAACGATAGTVDFIAAGSGAVYLGGAATLAGSSSYVAPVTDGGPAGEYILNVSKDEGTAATYAVEFHCYNGPNDALNEVNPTAPLPAGGLSTEFKLILDH